MASNDFYTDTTGLTVNNPCGEIVLGALSASALRATTYDSHAVTAATPRSTTIETHGVKYKTQTFEDRPTVFGSPLRMRWMVSDFDTLNHRDPNAYAAERLRVNAQALKMAIAKKCPDCLECPKCDISVHREADDIRQETLFLLKATCKSEHHTAHMTMCPNRKAAVLKGSTAMVPDIESEPALQFTDIPATMVPIPEPDPYMRPISPDTPMTAADEAW